MDQLLLRCGVLVELAERRKKINCRLGKTAVQKLLYLLQEAFDADLGYDFEFYTYGPYDSAVMQDIDYAEATNLLTVVYGGEGEGYNIAPGPAVDTAKELCADLPAQIRKSVDKLFDHFSKMNAGELELRATLKFVSDDDPELDQDALVDLTKKLKGRFDRCTILAALNELVGLKVISPDAAD